jgi:hypothetical protein
MTLWSSFRRNSYAYKVTLKESDVVRLMSQEAYDKLNTQSNDFQLIVREGISKRIDYLTRQYKEYSKVSNRIFGALNNANLDKDKYSASEAEIRELGDLYFIEREHKKAYECYK